MKNRKKLKKYFFTIILIILLLIFLKEAYRAIKYFYFDSNYKIVYSDNEKLDKSNPMTVEEIKALVEKGNSYNNYKITKKYNKIGIDGKVYKKDCETNIYIKDDILKYVDNDETLYWIDCNKNLVINTDTFSEATMYRLYDEPITKDEYFTKENKQKMTSYGYLVGKPTYTTIPPTEFEYEYLGETEINGRKTVVVKSTDLGLKNYEKYYIDAETGVIVNKENFDHRYHWLFGFFEISILCKETNSGPYYMDSGYNFSVEFDCVTDEDVKKPNITGRVVYNAFYEYDEEGNIIPIYSGT